MSFAEGQNLNQFQKSIQDLMVSYSRSTQSNGVHSSSNNSSSTTSTPRRDTTTSQSTTSSLSSSARKEEPQQEKKGVFGFIKGIFGQENKPKPSKRKSVNISKAENFIRVTHIGYDPQKGFVYENLPQEWQDMFAASGIDRNTLEDPQQAKQLVKAMKKFEKKLDESRRPPPPIPSKKGDSTPPPPPVNVTTPSKSSVGPPPPPPPPINVTTPKSLVGPPPPGPPPPSFSPPSPTTVTPVKPDARGSLLEDIRSGKKLKDANLRVSLALQDMTQEEKKDFASCLQTAMTSIRRGVDGNSDDDDSDDDDDWSD
jgi:hypothetical protein